MYERSFSLEIVAPDRVVFQGEATSVTAPGTLGGFQVLFNHAPLLSSLEVGTLKVKNTLGEDTVYATGGDISKCGRTKWSSLSRARRNRKRSTSSAPVQRAPVRKGG